MLPDSPIDLLQTARRLQADLDSCQAVRREQAAQIVALREDIVRLRGELGGQLSWRIDRENKDEATRQSEGKQNG